MRDMTLGRERRHRGIRERTRGGHGGGFGRGRLSGRDAAGRILCSFSFAPTSVAHGTDDENRAFAFAIPFDPAWTETLDLLTLTGPEGATSVDRARGARAALVIDRATGRVRSIVRDGAGGVPAQANDGTGVRVLRGLPRRPGRGRS
jgi:hypothetical protein